jgi:16S rRNA (adenine1518-N6/adenine1519-N6)-dimethyltransferase
MPMRKEKTYPPPLKRWSQNFLRDANIARKVADALQIPEPRAVVEVGPGQGMLTRFLIEKAEKVIAVEIDPLLVRELPDRLGNPINLEVLEQDFLQTDLSRLLDEIAGHHIAVIGNLPYHITSPIIFKILDSEAIFEEAVFMIQQEVGARISAPPGSKEYGILSVFCQFYSQVDYLFTVPARLFFPRPQVDSAVIRMTFDHHALNRLADPELFRKIVRQTFNQRRKMLRNTLSNLFSQTILEHLSIDLSRRPETLSVNEFVGLSNQIHQMLASNDYGRDNQ